MAMPSALADTATADAVTLQQAVAAALDPATTAQIKQQAHAYLDAIKSAPNGWRLCLALYVQGPRVPQLAFFCLQVLEEVLAYQRRPAAATAAAQANGTTTSTPATLSPADYTLIRTTLMDHIRAMAAPSATAAAADPIADAAFLKNKLAQIVTLLFAAQFPAQWPSFFEDLLALLPPALAQPARAGLAPGALLDAGGAASAARAVDLFLRFCLAIDQEIVNMLIHREQAEMTRNQVLKDMMREGPVQRLVSAWFNIVVQFQASHPDLAVAALKNVGLYISWIDVNLVANDLWVPVLFSFLSPSTNAPPALRLAAVECVIDLVSKGMAPSDKLQLLQYLRIMSVLATVASGIFPTTNLDEDEDASAFADAVAKLVNALGAVLVAAWEDAKDDATRAAADALITDLFPLFLQFFTDDWDELCTAVSDFPTKWLNLIKHAKKLQGGQLSPAQLQLLASLLRAIVHKIKYHPDQSPLGATGNSGGSAGDDGDDDLDEDLAHFQQLRRSLKILYDNVAYIHFPTWSEYSLQVICEIVDRVAAAGGGAAAGAGRKPAVPWTDVELAMHLLFLYGEGLKVAASSGSSGLPLGKELGSPHVTPTGEPTPLGDVLVRVMRAQLAAYPHACVAPIFFEAAVRYATFFEDAPEFLPEALSVFADQRGLHSPHPWTRSRGSYLLLRFIKSVKGKMAPLVDTVLGALSDLLVIPPPAAPSSAKGARASTFTLDMHLFETVGLLISLEDIPQAKRAEYLQMALAPLVQGLNAATTQAAAIAPPLAGNTTASVASRTPAQEAAMAAVAAHASNLIGAVGSVAKEFPGRHIFRDTTPPWVSILASANEAVLAALAALRDDERVRDAARFAFQRMIAVMGADAFPFLPPLTQMLLSACSFKEVADVLGFLGLVMYKYKQGLGEFMDALVQPVMRIVFQFLGTVPQGTDEQLLHTQLKKEYLAFLGSACTAGLDAVFISATNFAVLPDILHSVVACAMDRTDRAVQKAAIGLLAKFLKAWSAGKPMPAHVPAGWFDEAIRPLAARVCFEMPVQCCDPRDAGTLVLLHEVVSLHRAMAAAQGNQWAEYLLTAYLPSVQCPPELAQEYVAAVQQLDDKRLREYLRQFVARFR
ncbi:pre-tRNA nuclear export protein [Allomyces javanicus]|nr:pre-tRNA nuclear export protein [Allomyces javanicus]